MKVAAIYDIHGNLPALEAVLCDIQHEHIDLLVVGGDVVLGPMSRGNSDPSISIYRFLNSLIKGNCEVAVLTEMAGKEPAVPFGTGKGNSTLDCRTTQHPTQTLIN